MGWTVRGSNPGVARFSATVQAGPGAYIASWTMVSLFLLGVKLPGRNVDHLLPSSAEVKERVELYFYSTSVSSLPVLGRYLPLPSSLFFFPWRSNCLSCFLLLQNIAFLEGHLIISTV
jgi:hypothetical protein